MKHKRLLGVVLAVMGLAGFAAATTACDPAPAPCIYACWAAQPGNVWTPPPTAAPVYVPPPVPAYVPPPVPIVTPTTLPQPVLSNYWDPSEPNNASACITPDLAAQWGQDVANSNNVWVILYHGTIDNGTLVSQQGLSLYMDDGDIPGATYVTRDYAAAHDAAIDSYNRGDHDPKYPLTYDPWIVGSKMPYYIWQQYFEPYERPYTGWYPHTLQSTETLLSNNVQLMLFNYGIYNWGYSL